MMKTSVLNFIVVLSLLSVLTGSCNEGNSLQIIEHSIVIQEFTGDITQSSAIVTGVVKNMGYWKVNRCSVAANFYDIAGNTVAILTDNRTGLESGESWNFKIVLKGQDAWKVARYSLNIVANDR